MRDTDILRIGLIGCGWCAPNHLHAWQHLAPQGAVLIGVADIDPEKARRTADKFNVPAFSDAATFIDNQQPDIPCS